MASQRQCEKAFRTLAGLLAGVDADTRSKNVLDRTVSCRVSDLDVTWAARVCDAGLIDLRTVDADDDGRAQVRFTVGSDDLVLLAAGTLGLPIAVATGRLRVQANPLDLLRLGAFL